MIIKKIIITVMLTSGLAACATSDEHILISGEHFPTGKSIAGNTPIKRVASISEESFELGGWNAGNEFSVYNPGKISNIPKQFRFTQFQGPHSFAAETTITRFGNYSARLHWKHGNPGKWNGNQNKIDNVDRKAMLHGSNASSITSTTWYGFSVYFPEHGVDLKNGEDPLIFQLHGAPDKTPQGKEPGRNPPVALTIANEGMYLGYGWDDRKFATDTGGQGRGKFLVPMKLSDIQNRWVDIVLQVKADPFAPNGFIKMWVDGQQLVHRPNIRIGYNDDRGLYPSWGWYVTGKHAAKRNVDSIMYIDEIRHVEHAEATYYDVAPGYFSK